MVLSNFLNVVFEFANSSKRFSSSTSRLLINEYTSVGSKYKQDDSPISLNGSILLAITGHPELNASMIGHPKPSENDGKIRHSAPE